MEKITSVSDQLSARRVSSGSFFIVLRQPFRPLGRESAFILRIILPRCALTVI